MHLDDNEATVSPILEFALMHLFSGVLCLQVPE